MTFIVALGAPSIRAPVISGVALSGSSIQVSLTTAGSAANGIAAYQVSAAHASTGPAFYLAQVQPSQFPFTIPGLAGSTQYFITVQTQNAGPNGGLSVPSNQIAVTTTSGVPAQVLGLIASPISTSQINLSWQAATGAISYSVLQNSTVVQTGITSTSASVTGLATSTTYAFNVEAVNAVGAGPQSITVSATTQSGGGATLINFFAGLGREDSRAQFGLGSAVGQPNDLTSTTTSGIAKLWINNFYWGAVEGPGLGQYNFSAWEPWYNQCDAAGVYTAPFMHGEAVPFVTAATAFSSQYLPAYLNDAAGANVYGGLQSIFFGTAFGGVVPMLGRTAVINAFCNMIIAFGNHVMATGPRAGMKVMNLPYFLGFVTWETAYNLGTGAIDSSWGGSNQPNWFNNYANIVMPTLRAGVPNVALISRANYGASGASQLIPLAQAGLANKWTFSGGTDFTTSPTDMDNVLNGSVGGVDYRGKLPIMLFTETSNVVGGTYGDAPNGGPWSASSTATAMQAGSSLSTAWNACAVSPQRYSGDGWVNSTYAQWQSAFTAGGSRFAVTSPPSGWRAGPFT